MMQKLNPVSDKSSVEEICLIGAGPAGLAMLAYMMNQAELALEKNPNKKFKINVFDKRPLKFTRDQKIINYPSPLVPGIDDGTSWAQLCKDLFDPKNEYSIDKDQRLLGGDGKPILNPTKTQKFIEKILRIRKHKNDFQNFSIKEAQTVLYDYINEMKKNLSNVEFEMHGEANIIGFDLEKKQMMVDKVEKPFSFDTLILAEGSNREVHEILKKSMEDSKMEADTFKLKQTNAPKTYHCAVRLKLKSLEELGYDSYSVLFKEEGGNNLTYSIKANLSKLSGKEFNALPSFVFDTNFDPDSKRWKNPRFFVASEIPKEIFEITNEKEKKEKIIEWAKNIASYCYGLPNDYFEFDNKSDLATLFDLDVEFVDNPVRTLKNGLSLIMIGDSSMDSVYLFGNSSTAAISEAKTLASCILFKDKNDEDRFLALIRQYHLFSDHQNNLLEKKYGKSKENLALHDELSKKLLLACQDRTKKEEVLALLKAGANPNYVYNQDSPLTNAISNEREDIVEVLLKAGANPNKKTYESALTVAAEMNNMNMILLLFKNGADPIYFNKKTVELRNPSHCKKIFDFVDGANYLKEIREGIKFLYSKKLKNKLRDETLITYSKSLSNSVSITESEFEAHKNKILLLDHIDILCALPCSSEIDNQIGFSQLINTLYQKIGSESFDLKEVKKFILENTNSLMEKLSNLGSVDARSIYESASSGPILKALEIFSKNIGNIKVEELLIQKYE